MGAPYNSFTFDNINSLTEGVYISGSSAFNAPERDVEMIVIPGRNGEFIRDNGRFNNIEVTYPCGVVGDSTDFKTKMQNIRNKLASKRGYYRLVDTYNPNEYRMGVFKDAIEVEPVAQNTAGQFEVVFNCKPQRFLTSGETKTTVTSGSTVTNPTPFDAQPMIMTKGYGALTVNGYEINITNDSLGRVTLVESSTSLDVNFNGSLFDQGDYISVEKAQMDYVINNGNIPPRRYVDNIELLSQTGDGVLSIAGTALSVAYFEQDGVEFAYGTSKNYTSTFDLSITLDNGTTITETLTSNFRYYANTNRFHYSFSFANGYIKASSCMTTGLYGISTKNSLGNPTYIDCDLGEVYKIENDSYISLNHLTDLGSNLPILSPGENEITFDNTFTSVEIIPHWWVV